MQETHLRAWRAIGRFEPRAPVRAWMYRIATNVCLRMIEQRGRRPEPAGSGLEPYPDAPLGRASAPDDPHAAAETREAIGLAFIAAMLLLPPRQRAVLVLRDVLDWPAREVAELLGESVPAVNSLLQRARARAAREPDGTTLALAHAPSDDRTEAELMRRFQDAWDAMDIDGLVALLSDDALLTMPPEGMRVESAEAIGTFFATTPMDGRLDQIRLRAARANGQPALAAYAREARAYTPYGVMVFALRGDVIAGITGFPRQPALFARLGLPVALRLEPLPPGTGPNHGVRPRVRQP